MTASRTNIVLVILAIILVLGGVYVFATGGSESSATALTSSPIDANQQAFVRLAGQLTPVSFDASVLSDPRFTALTDISTQVVPESAGRADPFASIGVAR